MKQRPAHVCLYCGRKAVPIASMGPAMHVQGQDPLTASMLAAAPLMDQKQLLGAYGSVKVPHPPLQGVWRLSLLLSLYLR